ncbi:MAG: CCA tRNA nucleotidyltransferase, partial [Planctomycetaceae bacterium]
GCVRDLMLRLRPADYDVATSALPEQVRQLFGHKQTLAIGAAFGVILVRAPRGSGASDVEVATFRTEGPYLDGRRPEQVVFSTAEEDAQRRDFTINGLFFDPLSEELFDFVGGRADLESRRVRAIGDPRERFREDKLRMLRAVRITARFGFDLDERTAEAVRDMAGQITVVSQERISQELEKMLTHPQRRRAVELATELQILQVVLPELTDVLPASGSFGVTVESAAPIWARLLRTLDCLSSPDFPLALAALLRPIAWLTEGQAGAVDSAGERLGERVETACRRLRLSNETTSQCVWLVEQGGGLDGVSQLAIATRKRRLAHKWARNLIALSRAEALGKGVDPVDAEFCEAYLDATPRSELQPEPFVTGGDLLAMQVVPGPLFREVLERLYDAQLGGELSTRDAALAQAKQWVAGSREQNSKKTK